MGTTPTYALPYPELTDVANVPADMRELAEAVEANMGHITPIIPLASTLIDSYPTGFSTFGLNSTQAAAGAWPTGAAGAVTTVKTSALSGHRTYSRNNGASAVEMHFRQASSDGWSVWVPVVGPAVAYAAAAGVIVTGAVPANGGVGVSVTFPVGRFTVPPVVSATASSNGYGAASISTPSVSGVSLKYYNLTASIPTSPAISWSAVQMTSSSAPGLLTVEATGGSIVTCHTDGCGNGGHPIELDLTELDADGITQQIEHVVCGVCSQPITDIRR